MRHAYLKDKKMIKIPIENFCWISKIFLFFKVFFVTILPIPIKQLLAIFNLFLIIEPEPIKHSLPISLLPRITTLGPKIENLLSLNHDVSDFPRLPLRINLFELSLKNTFD